MSVFHKAQRKKAKLKLAITGPSGSGKTYSALRLAKGMGGKLAVIDTENGSASLYSDRFEFDVLELTPPFTTEKYMDAIKQAEKAGYTILIIDSITHAWAGEGGLLEQKESLDRQPKGNSYTNWATITKKQEAFKSAMLHSPLHIIATMRSKQDYILVDKGNKKVPEKAGMAPIQRDGMEYEFTVVFDVSMSHEAAPSKDRTGIFSDRIFQITEETGKDLSKWLDLGIADQPRERPTDPAVLREPLKPAMRPQALAGGGPSPSTQTQEPVRPLKEVKVPDAVRGYVIKVGSYATRTLDSIPLIELAHYYQFYAGKKNDPMSLELFDRIRLYLSANNMLPQREPGSDEDEDRLPEEPNLFREGN